MDINIIKEWFMNLGNQYGVNPVIFGSIYVGAIPFFSLSVAKLIKNYKAKKPITLPALSAGLCLISSYVYLFIAGNNIPLWVYVFVILLIIFGAYSTIKKIKTKTGETN